MLSLKTRFASLVQCSISLYSLSLAGIASAGILLLAQSGCDRQPSKSIVQNASNKIKISVSTGPKEGEIFEQRVLQRRLELFAEHYPDIEVDVSSWEYSPESFLSKMAGGTCPDIVQTWATEGPITIDQQLAKDITEPVRAWEGFSEIRPIILSPFVRDGRIYAFPITAYSMSLFYNKQLFRDAGLVDSEGRARSPKTWQEFVDAAVRLTDRENSRVGFAIAGAEPFAGWHFLNWAWQAGGDFEQKIDGRWTAVFDRPPVVQALQFLQDLRWKHGCVQSNILLEPEDIERDFVSGSVAMMIEPANDNTIITLVDRYGFDINNLGIAPLPGGPAGPATQFGADYLIINARVPNQRVEACLAWIFFSVSSEWLDAQEAIRAEMNMPAGCPYIPIFSGQRADRWKAIMDRYRNLPPFDDYSNTIGESLKAEPPYFCQQLYSQALSPAIQEALRDSQADPEKILHQKARYFQTNFLDRLNK